MRSEYGRSFQFCSITAICIFVLSACGTVHTLPSMHTQLAENSGILSFTVTNASRAAGGSLGIRWRDVAWRSAVIRDVHGERRDLEVAATQRTPGQLPRNREPVCAWGHRSGPPAHRHIEFPRPIRAIHSVETETVQIEETNSTL
jgi:hypothetical protein